MGCGSSTIRSKEKRRKRRNDKRRKRIKTKDGVSVGEGVTPNDKNEVESLTEEEDVYDMLEVTVTLTKKRSKAEFVDGGGSIHCLVAGIRVNLESLMILHLDKPGMYGELEEGSIIQEIDRVPVFSGEQFASAIRNKKSFQLAFIHPSESDVHRITVGGSNEGPISVHPESLTIDWTNEDYSDLRGLKIKCVDGVPIVSYRQYVQRIQNKWKFFLTLILPEQDYLSIECLNNELRNFQIYQMNQLSNEDLSDMLLVMKKARDKIDDEISRRKLALKRTNEMIAETEVREREQKRQRTSKDRGANTPTGRYTDL